VPRIIKGNGVPLDFCNDCFPDEEFALMLYSGGESPQLKINQLSHDCEHPRYGEQGYACESCGVELDDWDN
jgi:hypothetical protein